jgi:TonB family protein
VRADLEKMDPGFHFVKRESVINILEGRGFIALDAFIPDVLKAVATSAGADILVTDTLQWQRDGYELTSEVFDVVQGKKLDQFREKIAHAVSDSGGEPVVITDQASRVSMIINTGKPGRLPPGEYPTCVVCPDPTYTPEARAHRLQGRVLLMVTVTERGTADQIGIVDGPVDGLIGQAVEAVQGWQFKPAIGKDGKPFATRVPIEVTFRMR